MSANSHIDPTLAPLTVRVSVAAQMLGIGKTKIYELIGDRQIEILKIGSATLVVVASLHSFIERQRASSRMEVPARKSGGRPPTTFAALVSARRA